MVDGSFGSCHDTLANVNCEQMKERVLQWQKVNESDF